MNRDVAHSSRRSLTSGISTANRGDQVRRRRDDRRAVKEEFARDVVLLKYVG